MSMSDNFLQTWEAIPTTDFAIHRICPGKTLADASIFLAIVMSLATLKVSKAIDESGREIEPRYEVTNGLIRFVWILCGRMLLRQLKS